MGLLGVLSHSSFGALAGVVGPLIEVPVLVGLVYVALGAGKRFFPGDPTVPGAVHQDLRAAEAER